MGDEEKAPQDNTEKAPTDEPKELSASEKLEDGLKESYSKESNTDDTKGKDAEETPEEDDEPGETKDAESKDKESEDAETDENGFAPFTTPEGVELDAKLGAQFSALAKELGLSQEGAQKLVDLSVENSVAQAQAMEAQFAAQVKEWEQAVQDDPKLGGGNLNTTRIKAQAALNQFGSPEALKLLEDTKLAYHPEVVRLLVAVHDATAEDRSVPGTKATEKKPEGLADNLREKYAKNRAARAR